MSRSGGGEGLAVVLARGLEMAVVARGPGEEEDWVHSDGLKAAVAVAVVSRAKGP